MKSLTQFINENYKPKKLATRNDDTYSIDKLDKIAEHIPYTVYPIKDLLWNLKYISKDEDYRKRVDDAKLKIKYPILMTKDEQGRLDVLDGLHRLQHCKEAGIEVIPGKLIPRNLLKRAKV